MEFQQLLHNFEIEPWFALVPKLTRVPIEPFELASLAHWGTESTDCSIA